MDASTALRRTTMITLIPSTSPSLLFGTASEVPVKAISAAM
ncbi:MULTISPECIES: hypothetical protein [Glutamicibacter]|nr:hypothetical protein [Glutamicibacter nicotianae]